MYQNNSICHNLISKHNNRINQYSTSENRGEMKKVPNQVRLVVLLIAVLMIGYGCSKKEKSSEETGSLKSELIKNIQNINQFDSIVQSSGRKLLVFDLYADWCGPCKVLEPILKDVAEMQSQKANFYKVDIDKHTHIAREFRVKGIPYVVLVKEGQVIHSITGVQPKVVYLEAVEKFQ